MNIGTHKRSFIKLSKLNSCEEKMFWNAFCEIFLFYLDGCNLFHSLRYKLKYNVKQKFSQNWDIAVSSQNYYPQFDFVITVSKIKSWFQNLILFKTARIINIFLIHSLTTYLSW